MNDNQAICLNCGVNAGCGNKFCANCGEPVNENAAVCTHCGVAIKKIAQPQAGAVLSKEEAYKKSLPNTKKTAAIIWFVIAALQIIGGIASGYDIYIRNFVMKNKEIFE
ncbi:MAG: zinc-ribbon domain-containing protein [Anaerotruncus sp.]|nr:MAG: zinc-ribbon domain-containing protein [Anaerotruncus sp.]